MSVVRKTRAAARSLAFFVLAPGVVAGLVPWWLTGWRVRQPLPYWAPLRVAGVVLLAGGAVVLVHAFVRFVFEGVGTPAPVAPTERLVVGGLYRYVRNPRYLAVAATIVGRAGTLMRTETRVVATDEPARRRFRLYWRFVRPGSGLVRRSWLRAAKRRLERS